MKVDRQLCLLYLLSAASNLFTLVTTLIVWLYWQRTLNTCQTSDLDLSRNCGCILYGTWSESYFRGGDIGYCQFVSLAPIPCILWSSIAALYHGYRGYCSTSKVKVTLISKNSVDVINTQLWSRPLIIIFTLMSSCVTVLLFSAAVVLSDGYLYSCKQYRKSVINSLSAGGILAKAINDRFSCETCYDLLDYIQPDPEFLEDRYRRGSWLIDTDICLKISLYGMWTCVFLYLMITVFNFKCSKIPRKQAILNTEL